MAGGGASEGVGADAAGRAATVMGGVPSDGFPSRVPGPARRFAAALRGGWRAGFWLAVGCGVLDAAANAIVLIGLRLGDLTVVSVLTALYPAGTILLAAVVLRERIARLQWVGLVLALAASAMLSLA